MLKKLLLSTLLVPTFVIAQEVETKHVDFEEIMYWAGEGPNSAALVVQFNGIGNGKAFVWGYKFEDGATGEDMIRAIAQECNDFYLFTQYTGWMGNTVCGLGINPTGTLTDNLWFDFESAKVDPNISFNYYTSVGSILGQTSAPGDETPAIMAEAIAAAKDNHIIDHPLNAEVYGYAAYDYDHWHCANVAYNSFWQAAWYKGYWSYWVGSGELSSWSYSGLGMTSVVLEDGSVNAWYYKDINPDEPYQFDPGWGELDYGHDLSYGVNMTVAGDGYTSDLAYEVPYGTSVKLGVIAYPEGSDYGTFTYTVNNTAVGTFNKYSSSFTPASTGTTTITAVSSTDPSVRTSVKIKVTATPLEDVEIEGLDDNNEIHIGLQEMQSINYSITPADASVKSLSIEIENPIITIYAAKAFNPTRDFYELTAFIPGETNVTYNFSIADGTTFTKSFKVIVEDRERDAVIDYTKGIFWLNEEWFGHNSGSINFIDDEYNITYKAYERENPGETFGCTSQYGVIYGGNLIVMSKQASDGGDPRKETSHNGRTVIADAVSLNRITSFDEIGGDGRACVGVTPNKYYLGHALGVRVLNINGDEYTLSDENLEGIVGKNSYSGQVGDMIRAGKYVFIIQQSTGVYAVDAQTDVVVKKFEDTAVQGITQIANGTIYVANSTSIYSINPETLEIENTYTYPVNPDTNRSLYTITCMWGAWTSTKFYGSKKQDVIFWNTGALVYKWDVNEDLPTEPYCDLRTMDGLIEGASTTAYGSARYDDVTDQILIATTTGASSNYRYNWYYFIDGTTPKINNTQALRPGYFFPAVPVMADRYEPEFVDFDMISIAPGATFVANLANHVTDRDDIDYNINISVDADAASAIADVILEGKTLTIVPKAEGSATLTFTIESRGVEVSKDIVLTIDDGAFVQDVVAGQSLNVRDGVVTARGYNGSTIEIYDIAGRALKEIYVNADDFSARLDYPAGVYIIKAGDRKLKVIL